MLAIFGYIMIVYAMLLVWAGPEPKGTTFAQKFKYMLFEYKYVLLIALVGSILTEVG